MLLLSLLATTDAALPFKKVSIAKTPASTSSTTTTTEAAAGEEEPEEEQPVPSGEGADSQSAKVGEPMSLLSEVLCKIHLFL